MKYTYTIKTKRSWEREESATTISVVGRNIDEALDRFWVHRWKNGRNKRNDLDILSVQRGAQVVV